MAFHKILKKYKVGRNLNWHLGGVSEILTMLYRNGLDQLHWAKGSMSKY
jgi:hypothetical protein